MTRSRRLQACFLGAVFLARAGMAIAGSPLTLQDAQIQSLGIETVLAGEADGLRRGTLPGSIRVPNEQLRVLSAPVSGMIETLAVAPGDSVRRGQVLARLSSPQALELQREALQSQAQSSLQEQNLKRDEQLFAEGLIPESRLQATRAAAAQAAAMAGEHRKGLALAGLAPGKLGGPLALLSPIDGVILEQGARVGERIETSALIYRIARLSPLWLEAQAPVAVAAALREGMPVRVAGTTASGRLLAVGRAVDPVSQTVLLRAAIDNGAEQLRPGQVVEVEIAADLPKQPRIPAAAVVRHEGKALVFVQEARSGKETAFSARPVRILSQGGDGLVVEGVGASERIVVKGVSGLKAMLGGVGQE